MPVLFDQHHADATALEFLEVLRTSCTMAGASPSVGLSVDHDQVGSPISVRHSVSICCRRPRQHAGFAVCCRSRRRGNILYMS